MEPITSPDPLTTLSLSLTDAGDPLPAPAPTQNLGGLVVVSGPSGVGKGTMLKRIFAKYPDHLVFSISTTTRPPRPGEVHGREYFFTSKADFIAGRDQGDFLEWAEYAGNFYGTPRQPVLDNIALGKVVILEIELVGARQVAQSFPSARRIFISPPSLAELEQRLRSRSTDDGAQVAKRLAHAEIELAAAAEFDQIIVNDDLEQATLLLEQAIFG